LAFGVPEERFPGLAEELVDVAAAPVAGTDELVDCGPRALDTDDCVCACASGE
jgi:hypothetical protein